MAALGVRLAAVAAALAMAAAFDSAPEAERCGDEVCVSTALAADDQCGGDEACALNAAQLRAAARSHEATRHGAANARTNPVFTTQCFAYTGGTCVSQPCNVSRKAECINKVCVCSGCAGVDGICHARQNNLVAKGFVLNNAKYNSYKMFFQAASTFGQMKTTMWSSSMNMEQDLFDLYEVPGFRDGQRGYFLSSKKWSTYVLGIQATTGTAVSPFGAFAVDLMKKASLTDAWGPSNIMLRLCSMSHRSYPGGVQIGAVLPTTGGTVWAYLHTGSWFVYGSVTSPGPGGIWLPDPPLPASLQLPDCQ